MLPSRGGAQGGTGGQAQPRSSSAPSQRRHATGCASGEGLRLASKEGPQNVVGMSRFVPPEAQTEDDLNEWAKKLWNRLDRDDSGFITRKELDCEEFRSVVRAVIAPATGCNMGGATYGRAQMNMEQAIAFCIRKADMNGDNQISFDEFRSFMVCLRRQHVVHDTASLIFALFDLDFSNTLEEDEFRELYRFYLGRNPTINEFNEEWLRLNAKLTGRVTKEEYIRWLQTSTNPVFKRHAPPDQASEEFFEEAHRGTPQMRRSHTNMRWNRFHSTKINPNPEMRPQQRNYFSRPQSLPELKKFYNNRRGFQEHRAALEQPEARRTPKGPLSNDAPALLPARYAPGGRMRDPRTGTRTQWNDHWLTPISLKERYQPGTLNFRCPGPPPRHLYVDLYEDEL